MKPCIKEKARHKKRLAQLTKAQMRGKTNKNAFLQCLGPTLLSQEKAPNQSQLADVSSSSMSIVSHCRMEKPGRIYSPWAHGFMLQSDLLILCFSTMVIPCSCLGAVDLEKVTVRKRKNINIGNTKKMSIIYNALDTETT